MRCQVCGSRLVQYPWGVTRCPRCRYGDNMDANQNQTEKERKMQACVNAIEWFLEHPEAMKDDFVKVFMEVIREKIRLRENAEKAAGAKAPAPMVSL